MSRISTVGGVVSSIIKALMSFIVSDGTATSTVNDGDTLTIREGQYATVSQAGNTLDISAGSPNAGTSDLQFIGAAGVNCNIITFDGFSAIAEQGASLISGNSGTGDVLIQSLNAGTIDILSGDGNISVDADIWTVGSVSGRLIQWGTGTPEGVVTASPGSMYLDRNGGAGVTFYVKETGTGNTGWVAK